MADTEISRPEEPSSSPAPRSPYQNVRTNGRAFNSPNWRMKSESSPQASPSRTPSSTTHTSRTAFSRPGPHVPQAISDGRRLYVGNMPYTAKSEDVEALFTAAEFAIERIDIAIDPFTGRNPSYCFVDLQTKEHADQAMVELDGRDLLGRPVKIKPGVAKSAERTGEHSRSSFGLDRWRRPDATTSTDTTSTGQSDSSLRVYVGGLPRLTDASEAQSNMQTFFSGYQVVNVSKVFAPHPAKRFEPGEHYYLFVDLDSVEEAQRAMDTLNGQPGPWGSPLRVQRARGTTSKSEATPSPGGETPA
ncbi:hypothetical protein N7462_002844 [Penicillium macrosclerotiorum]|uniref:uncharacterized protein n=1 Tax=Penicillium macrosclerotiorum TaxID=303699 RepID=UPI002547EF6A|nr:uncharacterized protein N7462_002844 [Penicillium macrosclerotiorum]KAJ5693421.1 hypothetical protein N7462_002844 [Penicillium macrosclerotiorum]